MEVNEQTQGRLDLEAIRQKLSGQGGKRYWRSLEQVAETDEFQNWLDDEFPHRRTLLEIDRRSMLKVMGASFALAGLTGCRGVFMDQEKVVPYVRQPEDIVPGKPLFYATAMPMGGYGVGILVEQHEGRPTKIEGNPDHPESQGATSAIVQAALLSMYDPDRAQNVYQGNEISTWEEFDKVVRKTLSEQRASQGAGIRILTDTVASPLFNSAMEAFLKAYPAAKWHSWDAVGRDGARSGSKAAFGKVVSTTYDLSKAKVIVSLDSDFLVAGPGNLKYARDFANGRRLEATGGEMNRLYQFESFPMITGTNADHRWAMKASEIGGVAAAIAQGLGIGSGGASPVDSVIVGKVVADLQKNAGACVVIPGEQQPAAVHHLCHAINQKLGNNGKTVLHGPRVDFGPENQLESIQELTEALRAKKVEVLIMLGGNPAYDAPADLDFANALSFAKLKVRHSQYFDETCLKSDWSVPATHFLEEWGDVRNYDGSVSLIQPLIAPLFDGKSQTEFVHRLLGNPKSGYNLLKASYASALPGKEWDKSLHKGVVANSRPTGVALSVAGASPAFSPAAGSGTEVIVREDPHILDGRYANNGWLQELPKPLSKITWDNAIHISPGMAQSIGVQSEDEVVLEYNGQKVKGGVWVLPGHPEDCITVLLGHGRTAGGTIAAGTGFNAYPMRTSNALHWGFGGKITKTGPTFGLATVQIHHEMKGGDIVRSGSLADWQKDPTLTPETKHHFEKVSMYPDKIFDYDGPQWGMTIDLNTCIGCNACVTACQAENNIPVVGKDQVKRGRELHWIRLDRYYVGGMDQPEETVHQPVMCVHCEKAPCEPVCPVGATMHSHEGLNQMVYNRCVGTRYCSNNCPYKVRRFNYLNYADNQNQFMVSEMDHPSPGVPFTDKKVIIPGKVTSEKTHGRSLLKMVQNPNVTVRGRGIMEKCTYCVQRINSTRIEAKKQGRDIKDGEIVTACEQACPTKAIVFGNVADKESRVSKLRADKRSYLLLEELNTRPRTSYLGRVRNPNPEITA